MKVEELPEEEKNFQKNYVKAPSFLSIHMGVKASVLPADTDCHHFVLEVGMTPLWVSDITGNGYTMLSWYTTVLVHNNLILITIARMTGLIWRSLMEAYF